MFSRIVKYVTWLSNITSVIKKNNKLGVWIDFKNLNNTIPKDENLMPMANMLIYSVVRNSILSFIDRHSG